jgi:hypothetical protein
MRRTNERFLGLRALAVTESLMVLPAALLLLVAAVRTLQPRDHEPARTLWSISEWATNHIARFGAAVLFLALPSIAVLIGCVTIARAWRSDALLREDAANALAILDRRLSITVLAAATLVGGVILAATVAHVITD